MEPATYLFIVGITTLFLVVGFMVFDGIRRWWLRVRPYTTFFTESPSEEEMTMATFVTNEACIQIYIQFSPVNHFGHLKLQVNDDPLARV